MDDLDGMNYQDSIIYKKSEKKKQRKKSLLDEYEDKEIELIIPKAKQEKLERITPEQLEEDDSLGVDDFFITIGNKDEKKEKKKEKFSLFEKITKNFDKLK